MSRRVSGAWMPLTSGRQFSKLRRNHSAILGGFFFGSVSFGHAKEMNSPQAKPHCNPLILKSQSPIYAPQQDLAPLIINMLLNKRYTTRYQKHHRAQKPLLLPPEQFAKLSKRSDRMSRRVSGAWMPLTNGRQFSKLRRNHSAILGGFFFGSVSFGHAKEMNSPQAKPHRNPLTLNHKIPIYAPQLDLAPLIINMPLNKKHTRPLPKHDKAQKPLLLPPEPFAKLSKRSARMSRRESGP